MMTQEKAAKYFIVGWVKGWTLRFYFNTVTEIPAGSKSIEGYEWKKAHELFPWLPNADQFYAGVSMRRFIADNYRVLNDKLWDAADNKTRLALYSVVLKLNGDKAVRLTDKQRIETLKSAKDYKHEMHVKRISIATMRAGNGYSWKTCK